MRFADNLREFRGVTLVIFMLKNHQTAFSEELQLRSLVKLVAEVFNCNMFRYSINTERTS